MKKVLPKRRLQRGKIIRIRAGTTSADPIILHPVAAVQVIVEAKARATIFEETSTIKQGSRCLPAEISIDIQNKAILHYIAFVHGRKKPSHIIRKSRTAAGGAIYWHIVTLGGPPTPDPSPGQPSLRLRPTSGRGEHRYELISELIGKGATSSVDWISYVRGKECQSISVRNVFNAPDGGGEITMKSVAEGKSSATLHGMIEITEKGRGTVTHLTEDALILDPTAKINAVPALEIRTNDVKASHSAAISKVSPEQLFYLQSRGIPKQQARRIFVDGFLAELIGKIPDEGIREKILHEIRRHYS